MSTMLAAHAAAAVSQPYRSSKLWKLKRMAVVMPAPSWKRINANASPVYQMRFENWYTRMAKKHFKKESELPICSCLATEQTWTQQSTRLVTAMESLRVQCPSWMAVSQRLLSTGIWIYCHHKSYLVYCQSSWPSGSIGFPRLPLCVKFRRRYISSVVDIQVSFTRVVNRRDTLTVRR